MVKVRHQGNASYLYFTQMRMYQPSMLVVGSRNKAKYKHAYSGAGIFKYRLKHSTIPVVIVREKLQPRPSLQHLPKKKVPSSTSTLFLAPEEEEDSVKQDNQHAQHQQSMKSENQGLSRRVKKTLAIFSCT